METNKKIGLVLDSNVDGVGMAEILTAKAAERGYTVIDPGRFPEGTKDYMQVLSQIQKEGCDILVASLLNPELVTVWSQCQQLNYIPKTAVLSKGMHFVTEVQALGEGKGEGLCIETQWSPQFPFASSLTGQTSAEQSAAYEEAVGASPDLTIGWDWSIWDVIADVLTRAGSLDPEKIRQAFIDTDLNCTYGHVVFAENHVGYVPIVFGQWVLDDKWGYKKNIIAAEWTPEITEISEPLYIPNYNSSK
jgi:branched-chain amino acid transport system substrate-binding protein